MPLLEGYLKQAGPEGDPVTLAIVRQKLAQAELERGNLPRAAELFKLAEAFWSTDGARHAEHRLEGLTIKARLLRAQGDLAGSIATNERAIVERIELSGINHSETAILYNSLGIALMNANRLQAAAEAIQKALAIHESLGTDDDLPALVMRANVGALALRVGRLEDAERQLKHAFESQRALGGDSAAVAASMAQYGSLQTALGRPNEALPILEAAERMAVKFTAPASALHVQNRIFLAEAHHAAGHTQRAAELVTEIAAMARKQFGPHHFYAQRAQLAKTRLLASRQSPEQTLTDLMEVTAQLRAHGVATQLPLAQALVAQGDLLIKQHRAAEAVPVLEEAVRLREQMMWPKSWELAEARARLGEAQLATGKQDGKRLIEQATATLQEQLGANHPQTLRARKALSF